MMEKEGKRRGKMHQEREKRRVIVDKRVKTKQVERARRRQQMENENQREGERKTS